MRLYCQHSNSGCIVTNQVVVCVNKANHTHDAIIQSGKFAVSVISEDADFDLFKHFGFRTGSHVDKFDDFTDYERCQNGLPYITKGTNAYYSVKVELTLNLGSHTMFIGTVDEMETLSSVASATYEYYQKNIKPKPEAVGKTPDGQIIWRCRICGYEYVGEELPENFICPICKHPASDFDKIAPNA